MTFQELHEEISIEVESIEKVLQELSDLRKDTKRREPTVREKTAAATFLSQFYTGIENILKRISRFHSLTLPGTSNCSRGFAILLSKRCPFSLTIGSPLQLLRTGSSGMWYITAMRFNWTGIEWRRVLRMLTPFSLNSRQSWLTI
jgi:hypothetical protein